MTPALVVIGTSLGGLHALTTILGALPPSFPLPLAVVQHRAKDAPGGLREWLQGSCPLPIHEIEDKEPILPGYVYLAPADYHVLVEANAFALSTEAPVWYARPSIDVLFQSAADRYGGDLIGVVLTGASEDGAQGLAAVKGRGGMAIVQDPARAACPVMPNAAIAATPIDALLPLEEIAPFLCQLCGLTRE